MRLQRGAQTHPAPAVERTGAGCWVASYLAQSRSSHRTEAGIESRDPFLDPLRHRLVGGIRQPERGACDRVLAETKEEFELGFGHLIALRDHPAE